MIRVKCVLDSDLLRCIGFNRMVEVWVGGELELVGNIRGFTEGSVVVSNHTYLRVTCVFIMI